MAFSALKGIGWVLCTMFVAPTCYAVTSWGAAERAKLGAVESQIREAQRDIRSLETEFSTRASQVQLEKWNGEVLAMAAPSADQYMANEEQLASLGDLPGMTGETRMASVVPRGVPVIEAHGDDAGAEPAAPRAAASGLASNDDVPAVSGGAKVRKAPVQAVAMLDDGLLSELKQLAAVEKQTLR